MIMGYMYTDGNADDLSGSLLCNRLFVVALSNFLKDNVGIVVDLAFQEKVS